MPTDYKHVLQEMSYLESFHLVVIKAGVPEFSQQCTLANVGCTPLHCPSSYNWPQCREQKLMQVKVVQSSGVSISWLLCWTDY